MISRHLPPPFKDRSVLVTGGTGSFGKALLKRMLEDPKSAPSRVVIYSRDELKQFEMALMFPPSEHPGLRFFIGDVRDVDRLTTACAGIDTIIHAAALKQVPAAEYNPFECIKTNVLGAQNVVTAALASGVTTVVALSTDKAAAPVNLYGATKLCSDKLFVAARNSIGNRDLRFLVVRYGNVVGSRGSVIPFFLDRAPSGTLPITHPEMTRFSISLEDGVSVVERAMVQGVSGDILIPQLPSYRIVDVAEAIAPNAILEDVGIRPGEKIHEEMVPSADAAQTIEHDGYYIITPSDVRDPLAGRPDGVKSVPTGFTYSSGENSDWMSVEDIRETIRSHVDPDFTPF